MGSKSVVFYKGFITGYWSGSAEKFTVLAGLSNDSKKSLLGEDHLLISIVQGNVPDKFLGNAYTYTLETSFEEGLRDKFSSEFYLDMGSRLTVKTSELLSHVTKAIKTAKAKGYNVPHDFYCLR